MFSSIERYYSPFTLEALSATAFQAPTYSTVGIYSGFIQPVSGSETLRSGKSGESATHRLYTAVGTPAVYGQRVTQGSQTYIVLYATQPEGISAVNHHKEIILSVFE